MRIIGRIFTTHNPEKDIQTSNQSPGEPSVKLYPEVVSTFNGLQVCVAGRIPCLLRNWPQSKSSMLKSCLYNPPNHTCFPQKILIEHYIMLHQRSSKENENSVHHYSFECPSISKQIARLCAPMYVCVIYVCIYEGVSLFHRKCSHELLSECRDRRHHLLLLEGVTG